MSAETRRLAETFGQDPDEIEELDDDMVTDWLGGVLVESLEGARHTTGPTSDDLLEQARVAAEALVGRPGVPGIQSELGL